MRFVAKFFRVAAVGTAFLASAALAEDRSTAETHTAQELLSSHNMVRADFGAPDLTWSIELEREAQRWADRLAREGRMRHASIDERKGRGENLWMGSKGHFPPQVMVNAFASEKRHFKPGAFPDVSRTGNWRDVGHYTQLVWHDTREVGCAIAQNHDFDFLVCRYWPAGNIYGASISAHPHLARR